MKQAYRSASENAECSWFNSKLEDLFSEALTGAERERVDAHMATCASCREEVESLRAIDPLIHKVMRYRTALAATPARRQLHSGRALGAAVAALGAVVLTVALWNTGQPPAVGPTKIAQGPADSPREKIDKGDSTTGPNQRLAPKETPGATDSPTTGPTDPNEGKSGTQRAPGFAVLNAAGYERGLADFRGQIVLIGVLAPKQPKAAANLERLYRTYGTQLRLLAVAGSRKEPAPRDTTFQVFYNNGSDLLGAHEAEYAIVDRTGSVISRGSLVGDANAIINTVGAAIKALETR